MDRLLKSLMLVILYLIKSYQSQFLRSSDTGTQGCLYDSNFARWSCDFKRWKPPLADASFSIEPYLQIRVDNIDRPIPAGAFSGLNGTPTTSNTFILLYCVTGGTTILSRDIFTQNLHWVKSLFIFDCYLADGLPSRLLENLKSLTTLTIHGDGIDEFVSNDTLAGLADLRFINIRSPVKTGRLPQGFFHGLKNLYQIDLQSSELNFVSPNWFKGLISVQKIYLSRNNLQTLPLGLFDELPSLAYVWLHDNKWDCSCGLRWLLSWSHVTVGGFCENPSSMHGEELGYALRRLDCTTSTLTILSAASLDTKNTETGTAPADISKVSGFTLSSITTPAQKERIASTSTSAGSFSKNVASTIFMTFTASFTPTAAKSSDTTISTVTKRTPTTSWTASETRTRKSLLKLSSFPFDLSTVARAALSASIVSKEAGSYTNRETSYGEIGHDLRNIIFISTICAALTVLVLVTLVLYQCILCHMNTGRLNQVNSGEEDRTRSVMRSRHRLRRPIDARIIDW